jgi:diguanylate cyclase (GGDEF)-like protein
VVLGFVDGAELKKTNDRDGHAVGDALLVDVVEAIRSQLRSYDPVVRYGGDEFLCALSGVDLEGARTRFAEIQAELRQRRADCSISVGLAELGSSDGVSELTARADAALYEVRRQT